VLFTVPILQTSRGYDLRDRGRLKTFRKPVLIVTGKDTVGFHRRINDALAASVPAAERVELSGGHGAPATARDQFVAELRASLASHPW
jgi:pimeloyl-ACP methyl ester carboxylesterase